MSEEPPPAAQVADVARLLSETQAHQSTLQKRIHRLKQSRQMTDTLCVSSYYAFSVHPLLCDHCGANPFRGMRYKCLKCPEFNLCEACFPRAEHPHAELIEIPFEGSHDRIGCDECGQLPLQGIRYHCQVCSESYDLCHDCKMRTSHRHSSWKVMSPVRFEFTCLISEGRTVLEPGDMAVLMINVANLSQLTVELLTFVVTEGELPFDCHLEFECPVSPGSRTRCLITGIVNKPPGDYKAVLRILLPQHGVLAAGQAEVCLKVKGAGVFQKNRDAVREVIHCLEKKISVEFPELQRTLQDERTDQREIYDLFADLALAWVNRKFENIVSVSPPAFSEAYYRKTDVLESLERSGQYSVIDRVSAYGGHFVPLSFFRGVDPPQASVSVKMIRKNLREEIISLEENFTSATIGAQTYPQFVVGCDAQLSISRQGNSVVLQESQTYKPMARQRLVRGKPYFVRSGQMFILGSSKLLAIDGVTEDHLVLRYKDANDSLYSDPYTFPAKYKEFYIGRHPDNHLRIHDSEVSNRHARIACSEHGWEITDLGSSNGTYRLLHTQQSFNRESEELIITSTTEFLFGSDLLLLVNIACPKSV